MNETSSTILTVSDGFSCLKAPMIVVFHLILSAVTGSRI